jgi:hypothetical protein
VLTERRPTQRYRHAERDNKRERERGECSMSSTRSWGVFGCCRYGEKRKLFDTTQTLLDSNANTFCKRDNKTETTTCIYSSAKERVLRQCGKTKREKERERERDEVKFTKGGGRNVFKTGVQLTAAADLESVWEPRGGGGEEHRNLMSDHRPSTGLRFFLGASNLEDLWEKGPSRGFKVLTGSSLKPGRSAREGTFQRV